MMPKTSEEDAAELDTEEALPEAEAVLEVDDSEEIIPDEEGKPTVRKKVAALKARHRLEDYFAFKDIQDQLDYLDDEKKLKKELLAKVAQVERIEHPEPVVKSQPKEIKKVVITPKVVAPVVVEVKPVVVQQPVPVKKEKAKTKPIIKAAAKTKTTKTSAKVKTNAKTKAKPKPKSKSKPKEKPKAKSKSGGRAKRK